MLEGMLWPSIRHTLSLPYVQILIQLPVPDSSEDPLAILDVWNTIRTVYRYHSFLGVGTMLPSLTVLF